MSDWLKHNALGLILFIAAPVCIALGSHWGMEKLVEFGVGSGAAALYSFRAPNKETPKE